MVMMTMIARVADGLPLAATIQEDEQVSFIRIYNTTKMRICCMFVGVDGTQHFGLSKSGEIVVSQVRATITTALHH